MPQYASEAEIVYDPSYAKTPEEYNKIRKHNERAKMLRAERRERERFETPTIFDKFADFLAKVFERQQQR